MHGALMGLVEMTKIINLLQVKKKKKRKYDHIAYIPAVQMW